METDEFPEPSWITDGRGLAFRRNAPGSRASFDVPTGMGLPSRRLGADVEPLGEPDTPAPPNVTVCPVAGTVTLTLAGLAGCGCLGNTNLTAFSGLNGAHTLTWNAGTLQFELLATGSATLETYAVAPCVAPPSSTDTGSFDMIAQCLYGKWAVTVIFNTLSGQVFATGTNMPSGGTITNTLTCDGTQNIAGGTAVVS